MDAMLRKALRKYNGLRQQLDNVLLGEDGDVWEAELKNFLAKRPCWIKSCVVVEPPKPELLLEFVGTVTTSATTAKFVAKKNFELKKDGGICSYLGNNFTAWFGDKVEDPIGEQTLRYAKLRKSSVDAPIIAELGGEAKAETTLSEVHDLMAKQAKGEKGTLLNNGDANIFYVRDKNGVLRAVGVSWSVDGCFVYAYSVEHPHAWHAGLRVFSRNSVLESSVTVPA
ncbi:MAG: hypothetical protein WCW56_03395 [Candidatus Paceibacterota bacterium]